MSSFASKLKRLKSAMREWNKSSFGNVQDNVTLVESRVKDSETIYDSNPSDSTLADLNHARATLLRALAEGELFWK